MIWDNRKIKGEERKERNCITKWRESESENLSVMSDSLQPYGLYSPWNSSGQNTGVGSLSFSPADLPDPGIKPGSLPTELSGKPPSEDDIIGSKRTIEI